MKEESDVEEEEDKELEVIEATNDVINKVQQTCKFEKYSTNEWSGLSKLLFQLQFQNSIE